MTATTNPLNSLCNYTRSFTKVVFFFLCVGAAFVRAEEKPTVLVSVAPHQFLVEHIADGHVKVLLMVPPGASSHTYEPTPKQIVQSSRAKIWFCIGEPFETRAIRAIQSYCKELTSVDMREGAALLYPEDGMATCACHASHPPSKQVMADLHIWLSPIMMQQQAALIAKSLIDLQPEYRSLYEANLAQLLVRLKELDQEIATLLSPLLDRTVFVSHPAYAYFCKRYDLKQISVEVEGRDPSPKQMTHLLQKIRSNRVKTIFVQPQYNDKACRLVAEETEAQLVQLDPYSKDYFTSLLEIAHAFAKK